MLILNTNDAMREFGRRLKVARKKRYSSQAEFAEALSVKQDTVSKWESGRNAPEISTLFDICALLDIDLGYLLSEYDETTDTRHIIQEETGLSEEAIKCLQSLNMKAQAGGDMYLVMLSAMIESPELYRLIGQIRYYIDRLAEYETANKDDPAASDAAEYKINSERYGVTYSFEKLLDDVLERLSNKYTNGEVSTSG